MSVLVSFAHFRLSSNSDFRHLYLGVILGEAAWVIDHIHCQNFYLLCMCWNLCQIFGYIFIFSPHYAILESLLRLTTVNFLRVMDCQSFEALSVANCRFASEDF